MPKFSERMGIIKPPELAQLEGMSDGLSNLLYNFCIEIQEQVDWEKVEQRLHDDLKEKIGTIRITSYKSKTIVADIMSREVVLDKSFFETNYEQLKWHQKYTLIEIVIDCLSRYASPPRQDKISRLNQILERENAGYRMVVAGKLIPITNDQELEAVEAAGNSGVNTVDDHMQEALKLFSDRENPNYANSIKEAICALEALAQERVGRGKALSHLIQSLSLPSDLGEAMKKLYDYASEVGGIRHAIKKGMTRPDFTTAKFVIVTVSAMIHYITTSKQA